VLQFFQNCFSVKLSTSVCNFDDNVFKMKIVEKIKKCFKTWNVTYRKTYFNIGYHRRPAMIHTSVFRSIDAREATTDSIAKATTSIGASPTTASCDVQHVTRLYALVQGSHTTRPPIWRLQPISPLLYADFCQQLAYYARVIVSDDTPSDWHVTSDCWLAVN